MTYLLNLLRRHFIMSNQNGHLQKYNQLNP